jgi:ubiquinol-cytochrome c reductase cytochrome b subunit
MPQLDLVSIQLVIFCLIICFNLNLYSVFRYIMNLQYFSLNKIFIQTSEQQRQTFNVIIVFLINYFISLGVLFEKIQKFFFNEFFFKNFFYVLTLKKGSSQVTLKEHIINYPTPLNFNYMWSFGSLAGLYFAIQLVTGILLAMHYTPHIEYAFNSLEHIMRDLNFGWVLRYIHANGASFFFIAVYCHIGKALYYNSFVYPFSQLWRIGIIIFLLMIITAFMGYVLPWGQMSFWGATVITNLFTAIPVIGETLAFWLWGGYAVDNATLNRFFSLHYCLPFILLSMILLHLILLHIPGSSHPLKFTEFSDKISFYPYFYLKDLLAFFISLVFFCFFVFFSPNYLGHSDNYILANPLVTPSHIVPEWYFLPFYAILRSIPNKLGGVLLMALAIIVLIFLPNLNIVGTHIKNPKLRPLSRFFFWCFVMDVVLLGFIGSNVVETPFILIGQLATFFYFFYLIIILNIISLIEAELIKQN